MWVQIFAAGALDERREAALDFLCTLEAMRLRWDNPRNGYFLSTLLTCLLATDLSWTLSFLSQASASNLHLTPRLPSSRTILTGLGPSYLRPLLSFLSYFVRPHGPILPRTSPLQGLLPACEAGDSQPSRTNEDALVHDTRERRESISTLEEALVAQLNMLSLHINGTDKPPTEERPTLITMDSLIASRCALAQSLFASYLPYYSDHFGAYFGHSLYDNLLGVISCLKA